MPETPEKALETLLHDLFDADEFRVFLRGLEHGDELEAALAGKVATTELLFSEAVRALKRRGAVDEAFFSELVKVRPRCAPTISYVSERWSKGKARTPMPPPPSPSPTPVRWSGSPIQTSVREHECSLSGEACEEIRRVLRDSDHRVDLSKFDAVEPMFQSAMENLQTQYDDDLSKVAVSSIFRECQDQIEDGLWTPRWPVPFRNRFRAMLSKEVIPRLQEHGLVEVFIVDKMDQNVGLTKAGKAYLKWDREHRDG